MIRMISSIPTRLSSCMRTQRWDALSVIASNVVMPQVRPLQLRRCFNATATAAVTEDEEENVSIADKSNQFTPKNTYVEVPPEPQLDKNKLFPKLTSCCTLGENDELVWSSSEPLIVEQEFDDNVNSYMDPFAEETVQGFVKYQLFPDPVSRNPARLRRFFHLSILKPQTLYTIRCTHANNINVMAACGAIEDEALKLGIPLKSIAYLPTHIQKFTLLRSAHVDKYAREQLEIRRHKRVLTVEPKSLRQEYKVLVLGERAFGVISSRITMTKHIPANTKIVTLTFQKNRFQKPLEYD